MTAKHWLYSAYAVLALSAITVGWLEKAALLEKIRAGVVWLLIVIMQALVSLADVLYSVYRWTF